MRPLKLFTGVLLVIVSFALIGAPARAQGSNTFGLSSDDYALLKVANSAPLNSFAFQYAAQFAIKGFATFAIDADVKGSGAVDKPAYAMDLSVNGKVQLGTAQNTSPNAEVKWVGDTLYLNPGDGWQAQSKASTFIASVIRQVLGVDAAPAAVAKWDTASMGGVRTTWAAWQKVDPSKWVTAQRLADETAGNVKAAHFQLTANLFALMQTDAFVDVMLAISTAQGTPLQAIGRQKARDAIRASSALFKNVTLTLDQYIGLEDKLIHRVTLNTDMPLDPSKAGYPDGPFSVTGHFDLTLSGLNQPQKIAAPADVKTVTAFALPSEVKPAPPGGGMTQYLYLESIASKGVYTKTFDVQAKDHVTVTVRGLGLDFYGVVKLLAPDGKTLAEDDGSTSEAFLTAFDPQIADFLIAKAGTYTVQVTTDDGKAGSFFLTVTVVQ